MKLPIPKERGSRALFLGSSLTYLAYYIWFTGVAQVQTAASSLGFTGLAANFFWMAASAYTGPALQLIDGPTIINVRIIALLISSLLAVALGLNVSLLWGIYRKRGLKVCLYLGGASGLGAMVANLASFSYLCCGWAGSLVLLGSTIFAAFSIFITALVATFLSFNAYILGRRYATLIRPPP